MGAGIVYKRSMREHSGVMKASSILNWVMVSWIYTFVKTHQTVYLRTVHFTMCTLYLRKGKNSSWKRCRLNVKLHF